MKKQDIMALIQLLLVPVLLIFLGLILVINPDAASVLISRLIGYALMLIAVVTGLVALFSHTGRIRKAVAAVVCAIVGGWLMANPLLLAAWIGRFLGIVIMINCGMDLFYGIRQGRNVLFQAIAAVVGAILVLLPMTASRLVFTVCGAVVLIIGAFMAADRLRSRRWLTEGDDPNIIDAL